MIRTTKYQTWNGQTLIEKEAPLIPNLWLRGSDYQFSGSEKSLSPETEQGLSDALFYDKHKNVDLTAVFYSPSAIQAINDEGFDFEPQSGLLYQPNNEPTLYQDFLKVDIQKINGCLRFVKRYGILGFSYPLHGSGIEPLKYFQAEWRQFKKLTDVYFHIKAKKAQALREMLNDDSTGKNFNDDELYSWAYFWFISSLNVRLKQVSPVVFRGEGQLHNYFLRNNDAFQFVDPRFVGGYGCRRLIEFIYLKFYLDITNPGSIHKTCPFCGKPFLILRNNVDGRKPRKDRDFCSTSCGNTHRQAKNRAKKRLNNSKERQVDHGNGKRS